MENKNKKNRSNKNYLLFISLILLITIGFALLTQDLFISGSSQLKDSKWNIHWDNVQVNSNSVSGTSVTQAAQITNTEKTLVEYSISLSKPGDYYEFTVDAKNEGTIDGMVNVVSNKVYESNGTTEKTLPAYLTYSVTYSDGKTIEPKHLLSAGSTEKYKVRVEFKDVSADKLPTQNETLKFKFEVEYVQADDTAVEVVHGLTGTRYTTTKYYRNSVFLNQKIPEDEMFYETPEEARQQYYNIIHYLQHEIVNDVIKEIRTCIIRGETYCLRGGVNESNLDSKPIFEENKRVILEQFDISECTFENSTFECKRSSSSGEYVATISTTGMADWSGGGSFSSGCTIYESGEANCYVVQ